MEPQEIREGYLVKKGTVRNSWKAVWVVLSDDGVEFFKKKTDRSPKGMIPLKGATIVSPCQDFGKRMLVFKITTDKKQGHFFQASHVEEREFWVKDIKQAIACIQGGRTFARKSTRRSIRLPNTVNLNPVEVSAAPCKLYLMRQHTVESLDTQGLGELYTQMKDQDDGVREIKLEQQRRVFNHCFTGATAVEWLIAKGKARNRPEALMLATGLMTEGFLQPACDRSKDEAESGGQIFLDDTKALYYFADSGFFCEGYSSDEDVPLKEEFRGIIVKQGCLLKQGHRRKNWKVRKFILRDDPAYLHYYDPAKDDVPLGSIHLHGSVITSVEYVPDAKKQDIDGNLFEIITSDETHFFLQAAAATERKEWIQAVQAVSKSGK